jgi:DNA-binding phage protein
MSITIEDVVKLQHEHLRTIGSKIIYLTIRNGGKENGWTSISLSELARNTGLSRRGLYNTLHKMRDCGLLEIHNDKTSTTSKNKYRAIEL